MIASPPSANLPGRLRDALAAAGCWGLASFVVLLTARQSYWYLSGEDAYFHLQAAAWIRDHGGYPDGLPSLRASVFRQHWGDKEFLFHRLLVPFLWTDRMLGGKAALSLLNATVLGLAAFLGVRWRGRAGWLAPLFVAAGGYHYLWRAEMLRPHNLSLILLLPAAHGMALGRYRRLAPIAAVYALSYTAWQFPLMLAVGAMAALAWRPRERAWQIPVYLVSGLIAGILLHPGFPDNALIWKLQNIDYYHYKDRVAIGTEILRMDFFRWLKDNIPLGFLAAATVAVGGFRKGTAWDRWDSVALGLALVTLPMYASAMRFGEYALPFAALFLFGRAATALPRGRRAVGLAVVLVGLTAYNLTRLAGMIREGAKYQFEHKEDMERFHHLFPEGARVAAFWDDTALFLMAAPQAVYHNALDPIFMIAEDEPLYFRMEALIDGSLPDAAAEVSGALDSTYLAFHSGPSELLHNRIHNDPRFRERFRSGYYRVYEMDPSGTEGFVCDWSLRAARSETFGDAEIALRTRPPLEGECGRRDRPSAFPRAMVRPLSTSDGCWWAIHRRAIGSGPARVQFSSTGPARLYLDGAESLVTDGSERALINYRSAVADYREAAVFSCPGPHGTGFFWRERPSGTASP